MNAIKKSYFFALAATLLWSTVATAFKLGLQHFNHDITALLTWSVLFAVLSLQFILLFQKNRYYKISLKTLKVSAIAGFLNPFIYYLVLFKSYDLLPASEAQPLNYTWPITLSIISSFVFKHRLRLIQFISMGLGMMGVVFISTHGQFHLYLSNKTGVFLAVGSSLIWAFYWVVNIKDQTPALQKMNLNFVFGLFYLIIFLLLRGHLTFPSFPGIICAIWIGLGEMGLTFVLWMRALELAPGASSISHVVYLSPFLSLILLHLILGEIISLSSIIGLCLIIGGVLFGSLQNVTKK